MRELLITNLTVFSRYEVRYKDIMGGEAELLSNIKGFMLLPANKDQPGIIYCQKRETCERIALLLQESGISCGAYHAGLPDSQRKSLLNNWQAGTTKVGKGL